MGCVIAKRTVIASCKPPAGDPAALFSRRSVATTPRRVPIGDLAQWLRTGTTKAVDAGLLGAGGAAIDVAAVAVRAVARGLPTAAAGVDAVGDVVVWVDFLRPPGDTDRGSRFVG